MNDQQWDELTKYVERNSIPPGSLFVRGLTVPVEVDREIPEGEIQLGEGDRAVVRLRPEDFDDLKQRIRKDEHAQADSELDLPSWGD